MFRFMNRFLSLSLAPMSVCLARISLAYDTYYTRRNEKILPRKKSTEPKRVECSCVWVCDEWYVCVRVWASAEYTLGEGKKTITITAATTTSARYVQSHIAECIATRDPSAITQRHKMIERLLSTDSTLVNVKRIRHILDSLRSKTCFKRNAFLIVNFTVKLANVEIGKGKRQSVEKINSILFFVLFSFCYFR